MTFINEDIPEFRLGHYFTSCPLKIVLPLNQSIPEEYNYVCYKVLY